MVEMVIILGLLLIVGGGSKAKTGPLPPSALPGPTPTASQTVPAGLTIPTMQNPMQSTDPLKLGQLSLDSGTNGALDSGGGISTGTAAAAPSAGGNSDDSGSVASVLS